MSINQWRGFQGDARPFPTDLIKTDNAAEAARLWGVVEQRRSHVHDVEEAHKVAERAVSDARADYHAELERAALAGEVSTRDAELRGEWERLAQGLEALGDDGPVHSRRTVHDQRREAAKSLAAFAERDYLAFVTAHADEFLAVLAPACEENAEEWRAVSDANREAGVKRLRPVEERSAALRDAVELVLGGDPRFKHTDLPEGIEYHRPQFPADVFARIEEERREVERVLAGIEQEGSHDKSLPES